MKALASLRAVLGNKTRSELMIITPYKCQRRLYDRQMDQLRREDPLLQMDDPPRVMTVDNSSGHESNIVILDLVNTKAGNTGDVGFMHDNHRTNVAITQVNQVLIIVASEFAGRLTELKSVDDKEEDNPFEPKVKGTLCALLEYIKQLRQKQRAVVLQAPKLEMEILPDLLRDDEREDEEGSNGEVADEDFGSATGEAAGEDPSGWGGGWDGGATGEAADEDGSGWDVATGNWKLGPAKEEDL